MKKCKAKPVEAKYMQITDEDQAFDAGCFFLILIAYQYGLMKTYTIFKTIIHLDHTTLKKAGTL